MKRLPLIVLTVAVILAVAAGAAFWRLRDGAAQRTTQTPAIESTQTADAATDAPTGTFGGPFQLTDQNGMRRTDMDFRGKYMLIFFGYTYCPDICPTTLAVEAEALDKLGMQANRIVPIFVTVDPERDTPGKLKTYLSSFDAREPGSRPNFVGLTGSEEEIAQAAAAYRVYYQAHIDARAENGDYSVDHTGDVYLMGPDGKFVAYYSQGILSDEMAADLKAKTAPG